MAQFITFEGGEGCGKSTQIKLLAEYLSNHNIDFIQTREPGGTEGAEQIRSLLVNGEVSKWTGMTEALLNFAARLDHVEKLIKPSIIDGKTVICDRFFDSTIAYQGYAHGIGSSGKEDRYEKMGKSFHEKVRQAFLDIAEKNSKRCIVINADDTIENVHKQIISELKQRNII